MACVYTYARHPHSSPRHLRATARLPALVVVLLLTPHSSLITPHSSLLAPRSSLLAPHSSLLTTRYSLPTTRYSLPTTCHCLHWLTSSLLPNPYMSTVPHTPSAIAMARMPVDGDCLCWGPAARWDPTSHSGPHSPLGIPPPSPRSYRLLRGASRLSRLSRSGSARSASRPSMLHSCE